MNIDSVAVGPVGTNCFVVSDDRQNTIVIDPGGDPRVILNMIPDSAAVRAYVLTHGHTDHVEALAEICRLKPAVVAMHPDDFKWAFTEANQLPPILGVPDEPDAERRELTDGSEWSDGELRYRIIHTPGHTPGCVCLYFESENTLFCGDTLFAGSIGRTDLNGGSMPVLMESLKKLASCPATQSSTRDTAPPRQSNANSALTRSSNHSRPNISELLSDVRPQAFASFSGPPAQHSVQARSAKAKLWLETAGAEW